MQFAMPRDRQPGSLTMLPAIPTRGRQLIPSSMHPARDRPASSGNSGSPSSSHRLVAALLVSGFLLVCFCGLLLSPEGPTRAVTSAWSTVAYQWDLFLLSLAEAGFIHADQPGERRVVTPQTPATTTAAEQPQMSAAQMPAQQPPPLPQQARRLASPRSTPEPAATAPAGIPSSAQRDVLLKQANITLSTSFLYGRGHNNQCGLTNQNMMLLTLLTLAISLRVDTVVVPMTMHRDSFHKATPDWQPHAAETLWDLDSIRRLLQRHGIAMEVATNLDSPQHAVRLPSRLPAPPQSLEEVLDQAKGLILERLQQVKVEAGSSSQEGHDKLSAYFDRREHVYLVWLFAENLFWTLLTHKLRLYAEVAAAVQFNPVLVASAAAVAAKLRAASPVGEFNGIHLRLEKDWTQFQGISEDLEREHLNEVAADMRKLNFTQGSPIYIASGIFSSETGEVDAKYGVVNAWIHGGSFQSDVYSRHRALQGLDIGLDGFLSEQIALLDFLILQRADKLIGFTKSAFSVNVREYRALVGRPRNTSMLIGPMDSLEHWQRTAGMDV